MNININFNELALQVHENAKAKGFWHGERNVGELFMLIISELGEALEAHRKGRFADIETFGIRNTALDGVRNTPEKLFTYAFEAEIKDTFEDEIADTVIRILDFAGRFGLLIRIIESPDYVYRTYENVGQWLLEATSFVVNAYRQQELRTALNIAASDTVTMLFRLAEHHKFDLAKHIELKMRYNATRERLHGKAY